ncbi:MAG: hypothetical protein K2M75_01700 [Clostridia bacterium]|nr:hypothetical protein [Clostridia bacterium]
MKEYDYVEVIVEKEKYAKQGVHKGMQGTILDPRNIDGMWLVVFENPITFADELFVPIKEEDLKLIYESKDEPIEIQVEVIVEKEKYAKQGIHKGMRGMIYNLDSVEDCFEVFFSSDKKAIIERLDLREII